jgi:hypothetical protein
MHDDDTCGNDHRRRRRASLVRHYSHDYYEACGQARARHQITMWWGFLVTSDQFVQSTIAGPVGDQEALHRHAPQDPRPGPAAALGPPDGPRAGAREGL